MGTGISVFFFATLFAELVYLEAFRLGHFDTAPQRLWPRTRQATSRKRQEDGSG